MAFIRPGIMLGGQGFICSLLAATPSHPKAVGRSMTRHDTSGNVETRCKVGPFSFLFGKEG